MQQTHEKPKRNLYIDYLKALTILTVVIGHCIQFGSGQAVYESQTYFDNAVFRVIYSFHMPMFMLVSGYLFFNTAKKYSAKIVLLKKIQSICIPLCFWGTLNFIISLVESGKTPAMLDFCKMYISSILVCLWFLWALLYSSLITLLIKFFGRDRKWIYIAVIVIMFFITDSFSLGKTKFLLPFFFLGYFWNKENFTERLKNFLCEISVQKKRLLAAAFLISFAVLICGYDRSISIYRNSMCIGSFADAGQIIYAALYRWLTGAIGVGLFASAVYIIYRLTDSRLQKAMLTLSSCSLGIYIINAYANTYLLLPLTSGLTFNPLILLAESVLMSLLCWGVTRILQKIKPANILMFGGR